MGSGGNWAIELRTFERKAFRRDCRLACLWKYAREPAMALQQLLLSAVFLHFAIDCASALSISDLFHYGAQLDYKLDNETEDFNSVQLQLATPIVFYGQDYTSIYVSCPNRSDKAQWSQTCFYDH